MSVIIPDHLCCAAGNINICPGVNEPNPQLNKQSFASLHLLIAINVMNFNTANALMYTWDTTG